MHTRTRTEDRRKTQLESVFSYCFIICSVLEFLGPDNGTTPRYSFCLWVQPTNTNAKIIPLQTGLKYTHTQSQSLSQAPRTKTRAHTHTHVLTVAHAQKLTHNRIHSQEKKQKQKTKQSVLKFRAFHFCSHSDGTVPTSNRKWTYSTTSVWQLLEAWHHTKTGCFYFILKMDWCSSDLTDILVRVHFKRGEDYWLIPVRHWFLQGCPKTASSLNYLSGRCWMRTTDEQLGGEAFVIYLSQKSYMMAEHLPVQAYDSFPTF